MARIINFGLVSLAQQVHRVESESHFVYGSLDTSVFEAIEVAHGISQHLKDKNEPFLILMKSKKAAIKLILYKLTQRSICRADGIHQNYSLQEGPSFPL